MERENKQEKTIHHITHLHPLKLTDLQGDEAKPVCHACRHPCAASAYRCERCRYVLDPTCARLPQVLRHPTPPIPPTRSPSISCRRTPPAPSFATRAARTEPPSASTALAVSSTDTSPATVSLRS
ncbi:unnamed protein product [Musa banksii]